MNENSNSRMLIMIVIIAVIGIAGYYILNAPDQRSTGTKIGDAIDALPDGTTKAARELESRTPGDKLNDAAKDVGDDLKKATNQP